MKDIGSILEIFRASETIIHPDESVLERQNLWTSSFLKQELPHMSTEADNLNKYISQEVVSLVNLYF